MEDNDNAFAGEKEWKIINSWIDNPGSGHTICYNLKQGCDYGDQKWITEWQIKWWMPSIVSKIVLNFNRRQYELVVQAWCITSWHTNKCVAVNLSQHCN